MCRLIHGQVIAQETYLQDFIVILKRMLENYNKILKTCFVGGHYLTTCSNTYNCLLDATKVFD